MIDFALFGIRYTFRWFTAFAVVLSISLLGALGVWQLGKAQEKLLRFEESKLQASESPVNIRSISFGGIESDRLILQGKSVEIEGEYLNQKNIFLIHKHYQNMIGYEVVTPFRVQDDNGIVFVSRGWVTSPSPDLLSDRVGLVEGLTKVSGQLFVPDTDIEIKVLSKNLSWPLIIKDMDVVQVGSLFDGPIYPYVVRLHKNNNGVLVRYWPVINPDLGTHFSYAMQWFGMAIGVLLIFLVMCSSYRGKLVKWVRS